MSPSPSPLSGANTVPLTSTPARGGKRRKNDSDHDRGQASAPLPDEDVVEMEDVEGVEGVEGGEKEKQSRQSEQSTNMNF